MLNKNGTFKATNTCTDTQTHTQPPKNTHTTLFTVHENLLPALNPSRLNKLLSNTVPTNYAQFWRHGQEEEQGTVLTSPWSLEKVLFQNIWQQSTALS